MKKLLSVLPALLLLMTVGCAPSDKPGEVPPPPEAPESKSMAGETKEIIEDYGRGLTGSIKKSKGVQAKVDMELVKQAVNEYYLDSGGYPASIDDVRKYITADLDLGLYSYDPSTGAVGLK